MEDEITDEITMVYEANYNIIKILGYDFIKNNKDLCKLKINNKEMELIEYYEYESDSEIEKHKTLEVKLTGIEKITNMNSIFDGCKALKYLPDISKWNTKNITDMRCAFSECTSLKFLPEIGNLDTSNVTDMSRMFHSCYNLQKLDLSGWNTSKVTDMRSMFTGCSALALLLGIEHWDTSNVTSMNATFMKALKFNQDISMWDYSNVENMSAMFANCTKLPNLDISNFLFKELGTYDKMLESCNSLTALTIPFSAKFMTDKEPNKACSGVGTAEKPCILVVPENFVFDDDEAVWDASHSYFTWRGGYFKNAKMGDANGDDKVTVADVMLTVNAILGKGHTTFIKKIADVNKDNKITVSDVMGIVKIVLGSH